METESGMSSDGTSCISELDESKYAKTILKKGKGWRKPGSGSDVSLQVLVQANKQTRRNPTRVSFVVDDPSLGTELCALNSLVQTMLIHEQASFKLTQQALELWGPIFHIPGAAEEESYNSATIEIELVELVSNRDISLELDNSLMLKVYKPYLGKNRTTPDELTKVTVFYKASSQSQTVLEERQVPLFSIDEGLSHSVPQAVLTALMHMHPDEKGLATTSCASYLQGAAFLELIEENTQVTFDVHFLEAIVSPSSWELNKIEDKLGAADNMRQEGNLRFKNKAFEAAQRRYEKALSYIDNDEEIGYEVTHPVLLNLAACKLQLHDYIGAIEHCDKVLEDTMNNIKALFRRACALLELDRFEEAQRDFKHILVLEPENKEAKRHLKELGQRLKDHNENLKKSYGGFFKKVKGWASDGRYVDLSQLKPVPPLAPSKDTQKAPAPPQPNGAESLPDVSKINLNAEGNAPTNQGSES